MKQQSTFGSALAGLGIGIKVRRKPSDLVDKALGLFRKAQEEMVAAEKELKDQIEESQVEIDRLELEKAESGAELVRAQRVRQRFEEFLS